MNYTYSHKQKFCSRPKIKIGKIKRLEDIFYFPEICNVGRTDPKTHIFRYNV